MKLEPINMNTPAGKAISRARTKLVLDHPFYGHLVLNTPAYFTDAIPTAGTNGQHVLFNPAFVEALDADEVLFLVAHEASHDMLGHSFRRGDRDPMGWNIAADVVINHHLIAEGIGSMPTMGINRPDLYAQGKGTAEGVYAILPREGGQVVGFGPGEKGEGEGSGRPLDDVQDGACSPAEASMRAQMAKVKVAQATQAARMAGKMSAGLQRLVDSVLTSVVPWQDVLARFMVRQRTGGRSFARPNRRFIAQGLMLPVKLDWQMGGLVVAVDCSGSIGQRQLDEFAAEMTAICQTARPKWIEVVYFDSQVCHVDRFGRDDTLELAPHGGGGTDFAPIFEHMATMQDEPAACVVLTDLCCSSFGTAPECPVLWVSTEGSDGIETPFGEVISMREAA